MTQGGWDATQLIPIVIPALATIVIAFAYLARRVIDGSSTHTGSIPRVSVVDSSAVREITQALQDMVAAHERGIKAHERQAAATEALLAAQKDQIRRAAEARQTSEIDDLKRQVADLTRELTRDRPAPAKRA